MTDRLDPERAVRLLRAKAAELENRVKIHHRVAEEFPESRHPDDVTYLTADIALIAGLLADHIEQSQTPDDSTDRLTMMEEAYIEATNPGIDMDKVRELRAKGDPEGYRRARGAAKLGRPSEEIIRDQRGD